MYEVGRKDTGLLKQRLIMTEKEMQFELMKSQEKVNELRQEVAEMNKEREYWQQVRIQAAIEFAAQILGNLGGAPTSVAKDAVDYADALVTEIKRSDGVYAECRRMDAINTASVCENMTKIQKELQKKGGDNGKSN